jgi:phosphonate degradation associated HDIG domain protein
VSVAGELRSVEELLALFELRGARQYYGEEVSLTSHSLQAAQMALRAGASDPQVAAALLHDVGHMLAEEGEDFTARGIDDSHEDLAAHWLGTLFSPEVVDPIRLHVDAKRFLCARNAGYGEGLSATSQQSLALQGGPMNDADAAAFPDLAGASQALELRRWDDAAKVPDAKTATLTEHEPLLCALASSFRRSPAR